MKIKLILHLRLKCEEENSMLLEYVSLVNPVSSLCLCWCFRVQNMKLIFLLSVVSFFVYG